METGRKGDLESEPAGILWLGSQILVKSEFNMREVRHVKDVEDMLRILRRTFLEQHAIVSACEDVQKRVHMRSRCEVQSGANVSPIIAFGGVFVLPVAIKQAFNENEEIIKKCIT